LSLFNVFDSAGSGLSAQTVRLNVTASNLANADSISSSVEKTYRARHPVFSTVLLDDPIGAGEHSPRGVRVERIIESQAPLPSEYQPDHPQANEEGYIFRSNVNVIEEMANMMSASRTYQSNLEVMNAVKQMLLRTITLGQ
jgi:flagellar basal-body rod protein FlgC